MSEPNAIGPESQEPGASEDDEAAGSLDDLALDDALAGDIVGGSATHVRLAPGDSRHRDVAGLGRPTPIARHAAGGILQRMADEAAKGPRPGTAKALTGTAWLAADPKRAGAFRRTDEAAEGQALVLEATVNTAQAPEGSPIAFTVFQEGEGGAEEELDRLTANVDGGRARVEWTCKLGKTPPGADPKLSFKASYKQEQLRSPFLALRSFVAFTLVDPDGKPVAAPYAAKLPTGRERTGQTDAAGAPVRFPCPPGQVAVRVDGCEKAGEVELTVVDDAGQPVACGYRIRFADGTEAAGETDAVGRIAAHGAGDYQLELLAARP
jgi:hypothetical protein